MATVTTQISNVRTRFKQDPNAGTVSDPTILAFLNEAQDIVESHVILPPAKTYSTINLVADTQEYSLATNCVKVAVVRYTTNDWVLKEINFNDAMKRHSDSSGSPQEYYIWGESIGFSPTPSATETAGVKYWYVKTLDTLVESGTATGTATTSEVPVQFHWVLERGAEMLMAQMVNDQDRAAVAERKFYEGIQLMKDRYMMGTFDIDTEIYPEDQMDSRTQWNFNPYAS